MRKHAANLWLGRGLSALPTSIHIEPFTHTKIVLQDNDHAYELLKLWTKDGD